MGYRPGRAHREPEEGRHQQTAATADSAGGAASLVRDIDAGVQTMTRDIAELANDRDKYKRRAKASE